jgi:hypothetical protein
MTWNEIQTEVEGKYNLPGFKVTVLLAEKGQNKLTTFNIGCLKSLDINGPHWSTGRSTLGTIVDTMLGNDNINVFNPTHWCEIIMP